MRLRHSVRWQAVGKRGSEFDGIVAREAAAKRLLDAVSF
jgi:hypothetical protein